MNRPNASHVRSAATLFLLGLAITTPARAQLSPIPLPINESVVFTSLAQTHTILVDLETLPSRPELIIEVVPDRGHSDLEIEIELTNLDFPPFFGGGCETPVISDPAVGANSVRRIFWSTGCIPDPTDGPFLGAEGEVRVRVLDFGAASSPATLEIDIRGATVVPTSTAMVEIDPLAVTTIELPASKDSVLYERDPGTSNGAGESLWVGVDRSVTLPFGQVRFDVVASILAFDVAGAFPASAQIDDATLKLFGLTEIGIGSAISVSRVALDLGFPPITWAEGDANALLTEFAGAFSSQPSATWDDRESPVTPWASEGGDPVHPALIPQAATSVGFNTFSSPQLTAAVADMHATGNSDDGFVLLPQTQLASGDTGIKFASKDGSSVTPKLEVTLTGPFVQDSVTTPIVTFIGEGEDFRWIYDLDNDDVFVTAIGGICTDLNPQPGTTSAAYTYAYDGDPAFVGIDCCTWQISSQQTGVVGAGQALFFHNLDVTNPANLPGDYDADGIVDGCDNCYAVPNGPALGSCLSGPSAGETCLSDNDCIGSSCSLSQEDSDGDGGGDACVPEPGTSGMLLVGSLWLTTLARRERQRE